MDKADLEEILVDLETGLSLPNGFLNALLAESDWSFVIKCHALVESAITYMLATALDPRLSEPFARLNVSGRAGKLSFVETLDLLDSHQCNFIRKLSELRNSVVHDVKNVNFTFAGHVGALTADQKAQFARFSVYFAEYQSDPQKKKMFLDGALSYPKFNVWWGMIGVLLHAYSRIIHANAIKAQHAVDAAIAKQLPSL
jgi:hypothetical protein